MLNIILSIDKNCGIPWNTPEDLNIFNEKTKDSILIIGRKTFERMDGLNSLDNLENRIVFCLSRKMKIISSSNTHCIVCFQSIDEAIEQAKKINKTIFIIGGQQIYNYIFKNYKEKLTVHILFQIDYNSSYFDKNLLKDFYITNETNYDLFSHREMKYQKYGENQYLELIDDIIKNGEKRNGRNGEVISDFCKHLKFDLRDGFPLLTTKKMFLKGIVEELLFFIRGDTDSKILEEKGINIWKGNTSREFLDSYGFKDRKEGEMGPMYGNIWRSFNGLSKEKDNIKDCKHLEFSYKSYNNDNMSYSTGIIESIDFNIDQLKFVINEIKTNPTSRRILMTSFNPAQVKQGVLWPCHSITLQFYVHDDYLDMFCYNRSSDIGLGLPFNIASSSLFLMIVSKLTNLTPRYFNLTLGDSHIYSNHIERLKEQTQRTPFIFPNLILPDFKTLDDIHTLKYSDFKIENYKSHSIVKMDMVA
jgi:thymidylate synthase/dihydrofolate reductase